jgi:hypothetical protein
VLLDKMKGLVSLFDSCGQRHDGVLDALLRWVREECSTRNLCTDVVWRTVTVPVPVGSFLHQTDSSSCGLLMFAYLAQQSVAQSCRTCLRFLFWPRPRPYPHLHLDLSYKREFSAVFDM